MPTSELKVSEMTKRATEQSVLLELLLEPDIIDRGEDRDQHKQQLSLIYSATQPRPSWRMGSMFYFVCVGGIPAPILALEALGDSVHLHKVWLVASEMGTMIGPVSIK